MCLISRAIEIRYNAIVSSNGNQLSVTSNEKILAPNTSLVAKTKIIPVPIIN